MGWSDRAERGSERYLAEGQAPPGPQAGPTGRAVVEEPESRKDCGGSGGQHLKAQPLTAPSNEPESSRVADPRAGSEARCCGARFGNGVGERDEAPIAATVAESSGAGTRAPEEAAEKPTEATTSPLGIVSMRSANRANWDRAALSERKWLALDMETPQQLHSGKARQRLKPSP